MKRTDIPNARDPRAIRAGIAANRVAEINLEWDLEVMGDLLLEDDTVFDGLFNDEELIDFGLMEEKESQDEEPRQTLAERFIVPPFSVLDARQGYWQDRKRAWLGLGIEGEKGREAVAFDNQDGLTRIKNDVLAKSKGYKNIDYYRQKRDVESVLGREITNAEFEEKYLKTNGSKALASGTSIFDPVLTEISYSWFCPDSGKILDPFAGGSVRGIVASSLGFDYTGVDLSENQIAENRKQANEILEDRKPLWIVGDSDKDLPDGEFDFVFSCPPYGNLEVYSDAEEDISNMDHGGFISVYRSIIQQSVDRLKQDRFACFVVGDFRDKKGFYRNFVSDTISAFQDAGMILYNEMILVTAVGSLPIRAARAFNAGRKVGKTHQNVLVFYKGNPKSIKQDFGLLDISESDFDFS